jgi:hypothetical protein
MSERKKIEERLRKKEQEIVSMEEKIKASKIYVQALRDILKIFSVNPSGPLDAESETTLRAGSAVDQARRIVLEKGIPVHINEILLALGMEVTRQAKASLTSSLAAYVRREDIFTRPAPNTFGLIELGHTAIDENTYSEPPVGFGQQLSRPRNFDDEISF